MITRNAGEVITFPDQPFRRNPGRAAAATPEAAPTSPEGQSPSVEERLQRLEEKLDRLMRKLDDDRPAIVPLDQARPAGPRPDPGARP